MPSYEGRVEPKVDDLFDEFHEGHPELTTEVQLSLEEFKNWCDEEISRRHRNTLAKAISRRKEVRLDLETPS